MNAASPHVLHADGDLSPDDRRLPDLVTLLEAGRDHGLSTYPHAERMEQCVVVYESASLRAAMTPAVARSAIRAQVARALASVPGIVVFAGAFERAVVEPVTDAFEQVIAEEKSEGQQSGDHFAAPGANDRVRNALEKLAVLLPQGFVDYYANDMLALAASAWLGPGFHITSQVNVVNPGGAAQTVHRDYHCGLSEPDGVPRVSRARALAVTRRNPARRNRALRYARGRTDALLAAFAAVLPRLPRLLAARVPGVLPQQPRPAPVVPRRRCVLQSRPISRRGLQPDGLAAPYREPPADQLRVRPSHGVDRSATVRRSRLPDAPRAQVRGMEPALPAKVVATTAEGYAVPTNHDRDPPLNGMSPLAQADLVRSASGAAMTAAELHTRLDAHAAARRTR